MRSGVCVGTHKNERIHVTTAMNTDIAGQERFWALVPMYYQGAQAAIVGFDVTDGCTVETCDHWIKELRTNRPDCVVVAVGNKIDLVESRKVSTEDARAHFETMNPSVPYFETSAKTGEGVNELFESLTRMIIERNTMKMGDNENETKEDAKEAKKDGEGETTKDGKCIIC